MLENETQNTSFETAESSQQNEQSEQQSVQQGQVSQEQSVQQQVSVPDKKETPAAQPKKTNGDRIAELETKLARFEALLSLKNENVVDMEVCTDLLMKGYTVEQLKQSKPYLFNQQTQTQPQNLGLVKQAPKVVAGTQAPKVPTSISSEGFVEQLASMLTSKF
mgnify:CR=1 FL=1|jgi:hypothetical protein